MNANGAITCFFTVYLIPIALHFKAYHGQNGLMIKMKKNFSKIGQIYFLKSNTKKQLKA